MPHQCAQCGWMTFWERDQSCDNERCVANKWSRQKREELRRRRWELENSSVPLTKPKSEASAEAETAEKESEEPPPEPPRRRPRPPWRT